MNIIQKSLDAIFGLLESIKPKDLVQYRSFSKRIEKDALSRKLLDVHSLKGNAPAVFDRDIDVAASVISTNGSTVESRVFGDRVVVPTFEVSSNPTVKFSEYNKRPWILDRAIKKGIMEVFAQELALTLSAIEAAALESNVSQDIANVLSKNDVLNIISEVTKHGLPCSKIVLHQNELSDIKKWGSDNDVDLMLNIKPNGFCGKVFNIDTYVSHIVPPGTVYALSTPDNVGKIITKGNVSVYNAHRIELLKYGWVIRSEIGIGILHTNGVAIGKKYQAEENKPNTKSGKVLSVDVETPTGIFGRP